MKNNAVPQLIEGCPICTSSSPTSASLTAVKSVMKSSNQELSEATGFSIELLEEHFAQHISRPDTGDERLDAALVDCEQLYLTALISNDLRSAAQVISIRARLINDLARRRKDTAKRQNLLGKAVPGDVRTYPAELATFIQSHIESIIERATECEAAL